MENNSNSDYRKKTENHSGQLLSYFESHLNKYPDGPKSSGSDIELGNVEMIPQIDLDDEEEENTIEDENEDDRSHFDDDYEERYVLMESNRDDFTEPGY